jgi:hypothetical protein
MLKVQDVMLSPVFCNVSSEFRAKGKNIKFWFRTTIVLILAKTFILTKQKQQQQQERRQQ